MPSSCTHLRTRSRMAWASAGISKSMAMDVLRGGLVGELQTVDALGRAGEEVGLFGRRIVLGEHLEGVPERRVVARAEVDREVALEHATARAEELDRGLEIGL